MSQCCFILRGNKTVKVFENCVFLQMGAASVSVSFRPVTSFVPIASPPAGRHSDCASLLNDRWCQQLTKCWYKWLVYVIEMMSEIPPTSFCVLHIIYMLLGIHPSFQICQNVSSRKEFVLS